ncbi:hypothetical protein ACIBL8_38830 [Streptomyces sp. NPDC050523]|uniref:hypothetical protein n=1 Tax=Streptomyces sp. NPDC050523 TaxID=3365622 RepID=UPI0037BA9B80
MDADDRTSSSQWAANSLEHFDQLARGVLKAARAARRELRRRPPSPERRAWALGVLAGQTQAMLAGEQLIHPPVEAAAQEEFVCTSLQLAVHALAHRWTEEDLGLAGQAEVPHLGERQTADAFDVLGRLMLPHSSAEGWTAAVLTDLTRGDETWGAVVKLGKYILHPTFLTLADDATRVMGEAVHNINVDGLRALADSVRQFGIAAEPVPEPIPTVESPAPEHDPLYAPMPLEDPPTRGMFETPVNRVERRRRLTPPRRASRRKGMDPPGPDYASQEVIPPPEPPSTRDSAWSPDDLPGFGDFGS